MLFPSTENLAKQVKPLVLDDLLHGLLSLTELLVYRDYAYKGPSLKHHLVKRVCLLAHEPLSLHDVSGYISPVIEQLQLLKIIQLKLLGPEHLSLNLW